MPSIVAGIRAIGALSALSMFCEEKTSFADLSFIILFDDLLMLELL